MRINASEFWKGRDNYSRLQDEYYDFITHRGYDLERGQKGSTAEHLSVAEYKLKKSQEQLAEVKKQISEIEDIDNVPIKSLPMNNVIVKRDDFKKISLAAKKYITVKKYEKENAALKEENAVLKSEAAEKDNQLSAVNMELSESKSLQDKFDKVMKFIEQQRLKDKLEEFLNPVIHHKHSR